MTKTQARRIAKTHINAIEKLSQSEQFFYLKKHSIDPPKAANDDGYQARLICRDWWTRRILSKAIKDREAQFILSGDISKGRQVYVSDTALKEIQTKHAKTLEFLGTKMMVSEDGDEVDMLDILRASLANPTNRRAELMVRMAGFEQFADESGHVGMFYTITTPSKYHRFSGSKLNENYQHTPRQGQDYLVALWAKIRAQFKRDGINPYGFRVAEPHHDGTPHWHMLLFMPPEHADICTDIMRGYAMREDGDELGAEQHRFTVKEIVKEIITKDGIKKVSATGYIAKYIAKNIGFDIDGDEISEGISPIGERVRSWASLWNIRQFQQIGGAGVTVWRELRRLKDQEIEHDLIRQARDLSVANDWAGFLELMGGTEAKRIEREIQLLKKNTIDTETGDIKLNRYSEIVEKIVGITAYAIEVLTHVKSWQVITKVTASRETSAGALCADAVGSRFLEFYN